MQNNALIHAQGMGPYMPGLRPGMAGFGGPIGPVRNPRSPHIKVLFARRL